MDRHIDGRAGLIAERRMHAGTSRGQSADECGLLTHGTYRRLRQIVDLAGQQTRNAAGEEQGQVGGRIVCLRTCLSIRRDRDDGRRRIDPPQLGHVVGTRRPFLSHDQMRCCQALAPFRFIHGNGFAVIQIVQQHRAGARVDAGHLRTDIGQQSTTNRGRRAAADLNHIESGQQRHVRCSSSRPGL